MTLTEMLKQQEKHRPLTTEIVKDVFKKWLEEISLGATQDRAMYVPVANSNWITEWLYVNMFTGFASSSAHEVFSHHLSPLYVYLTMGYLSIV